MKIKLCCPFYNENLVAKINIAEASKFVDEIHLTECNKSFKYKEHNYCFEKQSDNKKLFYHQIDGNKLYKRPRKYIPHIFLNPISKWMNHICFDTAWYNEGVSRNNSLWNSEYSDEDIIILSDIDEIIDYKYFDEIIESTKKYGIVTINIYFTMFYFNLFCNKWSGPQKYSYRIFCVRGDIMRKRFFNDSDFLRKQGEQFHLLDEVKCLDGMRGFHHSWLGDEKFVVNKLKSYAHTMDNHSLELYDNAGNININTIKQHIQNGISIFDNSKLEINNEIKLLKEVENIKKENPTFFI